LPITCVIAEELNTDVSYAHPYSSWERATNENTNGLLRQYFQKGSDFSGITPERKFIAQIIQNTRPRYCTDLETLEMVFF